MSTTSETREIGAVDVTIGVSSGFPGAGPSRRHDVRRPARDAGGLGRIADEPPGPPIRDEDWPRFRRDDAGRVPTLREGP